MKNKKIKMKMTKTKNNMKNSECLNSDEEGQDIRQIEQGSSLYFNRIINTEKNITSYQCAYRDCNQVYSKRDNAYRHYIRQHTTRYQCKICKSCFGTIQDLRQHRRIHTGEKPFVCEYKSCNQSFSSKSNLMAHLRRHRNGKKYQCKYCSKKFFDKCNCVTHERTHTGEKPFICHYCNKKFKTSSNRNVHQSKHI